MNGEKLKEYEEFMATRVPVLPEGQDSFTRSDVIQAWAAAANSALTFIARSVVREEAKHTCPVCGRVHECPRFPSEEI